MDQGPLVSEQIEAEGKFVAELGQYAPLSAAFWLKDSDTGNWHLWVASKKITDRTVDHAYDEIIRIARSMTYPAMDTMQVKVAGMKDREVMAMLAEIARRGGKHPFRLRQEMASGGVLRGSLRLPVAGAGHGVTAPIVAYCALAIPPSVCDHPPYAASGDRQGMSVGQRRRTVTKRIDPLRHERPSDNPDGDGVFRGSASADAASGATGLRSISPL